MHRVLPVSVLRPLVPILSSPLLSPQSFPQVAWSVCLASHPVQSSLVVVHLKHAHALILALALTFASRPRNARPHLVSSRPAPCYLITLLSLSCICAQEGSILAYISMHIHIHPHPLT